MAVLDVAVIGAGPAGGSAARHSVELGLKTVLLEEHKSVGEPVHCGECLSELSMQRLHWKIPDSVVSEPVKGVRVIFPNNSASTVTEPGYVLEKHLFEQWIAQEAQKKGAEILLDHKLLDLKRENGAWKLQTNHGEIQTKVVIDASGPASVTSRKLQLNPPVKSDLPFDTVTGLQYELLDIPRDGYLDFYLWPKYSPWGYCVTKNTEIIAKNTVKPISDVKMGEEVLTLEGWAPVTGISERLHDGKVISIIPYMLNKSAELTPEHEVFVWNKKNGFEWKPAGILVKGSRENKGKGDYLIFPLPKEPKRSEITISDYVEGIVEKSKIFPIGKNQFGAKFKFKNGINNKLEFTPELMEFFGYYVSEGNTNSSGIIISNTNQQIIKRIVEIGERAFGLTPSIWVDKCAYCSQVNFGSIILKKLFACLFSEGVHNKKLPHFLYGLDEDLKFSFLKGQVLGDGCKETGSKGQTIISLTTVSKSLVYDTWLMLATSKVIPSIKYNSKKKFWQLKIAGRQLSKLEKYFGKCSFGKTKTSPHFRIKDDKILVGIRKLDSKPYIGMVYDIEASGSFCPFFAVHNCWMIPKKDGRANVGLVTTQTSKAKFFLDEFVREMKWEQKSKVKTFGGSIPHSGPVPNTISDGLFLVGDAAGFTSPLFEGGTQLGLRSGQFAAQVAARAIKENKLEKSNLTEYERLWKKEFPSYSALIKGKKALYDFSDAELNEMAGILPKELGNLKPTDKVKVGLKILAKHRHLLQKGVVDAFLAFAYSRAEYYGW